VAQSWEGSVSNMRDAWDTLTSFVLNTTNTKKLKRLENGDFD